MQTIGTWLFIRIARGIQKGLAIYRMREIVVDQKGCRGGGRRLGLGSGVRVVVAVVVN